MLTMVLVLASTPAISASTQENISEQSSPAYRGTQNWEESQSSFLVFPGIVLSIIALAYFFNRD